MLPLFESKSNAFRTAKLLLEILNVKISDTTLKKEIEEHPDYPSLLSISDVLNTYHVENLSVKFQHDQFVNIPTPFITPIKDSKIITDSLTVVKEITADTVHFFEPEKNQWVICSKEDFLKRWTSGIVLLTEVESGAGEKGYDEKIRVAKRNRAIQYLTTFSIPAIVIIAGINAIMQKGISTLFPFIFLVLALIGTITGVLLLWFEIDQHNPIIQQICSAGKKANCGAVLQSKASKIMGISWSAIGFSYFMGMLLLLLLKGIANPQALFITAWVNVLAVPYVIYSIYYQWRVAKQWCLLCLSVQSILVLQLVTALIDGWHTLLPLNNIGASLILQSITAFITPFIFTTILLPALQKAKESKSIHAELQRLKHNPQIFESLLHKQKKVTENPEGLGITLGNPNATYKLVKVCNPYCGPCADAHIPMEELLHNNPDVQIQILFTASNKEGDSKAPPVKHLLAIAETNDEKLIKQALGDWYLADKKDYEVFAAKYPMNGELKQQDDKIEAMQNWCNKVKIEFTPTFFISINNDGQGTNFHQLPKIYRPHDLKYFLSV
ncbi:vitamin K epoxide reductase family protein [Mucilaginibacter sp. X5P1]|uniref:vitamin K epoxide reductase family protein n=1 Tax=Mucilaginibacter sp. X5P1 TaxID=2723088 RepID=UPI001621EACC|nr:vitamin K epoxide reductase family protein [Mucilaginibacter sp. X5P1]MBB6138289.1 putative membrane protein [Mucilaginibacter sp. X5P1]